MSIIVRNYEPKDLQDLERFVVGLQDYESQLEPDRLPGNQVFEKYTKELLDTNKVFVLEVDNKAVGFCAARIEHDDEIISKINQFIYLSDIYIEPEFRKMGLSKSLFKKVEEYARFLNQKYIKFNVLFKNEIMRKVANSEHFIEHEVVYIKELLS